MQLRFQPGAQLHKLGSITDQLAQFPDRWRRDPRLGHPSQAEQVDEIGGVAFVVLHAALAPVQRRRCRQVQIAAQLVEEIRGPVPAIGRLENHLRLLAGIGDRRREIDRIVKIGRAHV